MEIRRVFKSGNSYVVSLSKNVVETFGVKAGDHIEFSIRDGKVTIKPYKRPDRVGVIKKVAGCLKDRDSLYKDLLEIRNDDEDREELFSDNKAEIFYFMPL
ncbi:AbrB/MazE/SpoVT family DNA-binding domain-containing protein [Thermincola potens]|uniref:SpoVT/AbrB domain protein n=1 Tax=Thermincola potens (strain JR) TaxID=635013 RepID=D5XD30_THEPJ|nr:AbrB/MazE/SpoVT family DNA-binding domain-containing protein [Thermincola potens]ADG83706.1 SpoVT/AbrB domain protein [Thermincola potens JR]